MSGITLGIAGIIVMLAVLFFLRLPAGIGMALVGFAGVAYITNPGAALQMTVTDLWTVFSNYGFTVIPMFMLVGEIVHHAGYSDSLYYATNKWFGHRRGGLAITTIMASAAFSAISGSNTATAATMSRVAIPSMEKYKYHPALNSGSVAAGATLGVLIPPSIVLVVYGIYTGQSIGKLFYGNVIPSVICTVLIAATVSVICRIHPTWGPRSPKSSWKERFEALPEALDIIVLFLIIMASLFTGVVTATEAAALSCAVGLAIVVIRKKLTWEKFTLSIIDTMRLSAMVFIIIAGATIFGKFLALTRLPFEAAGAISALHAPRPLILALVLLCYIIGGCIMDALAFLLISLPIFFPLVSALGYDPVWFGQVITIVTTMGSIMPPVGICCYVVHGMARHIPLATVFRGSMYYLPAYIVALVVLILFPYGTVMVLSDLVK
jgi:tripartite ATP-independent transporter DctM subunit